MKKLLFLFFVAMFLPNAEFKAQDKNPLQKIVSDDRDEGDSFGGSSSICGDYAIVGSMSKRKNIEQNILKEAGSAYIFKKEAAGNWKQMQKLEPEVIKADNYFGGSVDINGIYAVVGASGEDDSKESDPMIRMGAVHVFGLKGGKWLKVQNLELAKKDKHDNFGYSVSISEKYIVVGCPGRNFKGQNFNEPTGAVYVYSIAATGGWIPLQEITAPTNSGFWFGRTVSVSGNDLVVGTANGGAVFVYEYNKMGRWELRSTLKQSEVSDVGFGGSLGIYNDRIIVGAEGDFDVFEGMERPNTDSILEIMNEEPNGTFSKIVIPNTKHLRDSFGVQPAQFKAMAKPVESTAARRKRMAGAGAAYVYKKNDDGSWGLAERIIPKGISADDHFGSSVSISDSLIIIGATGDKLIGKGIKDNYNAGAVYLFKLNKEGKFAETKKITANKRTVWSKFGSSVEIWQGEVIIGSRFEAGDAKEKFPKRDAGAAYIYKWK